MKITNYRTLNKGAMIGTFDLYFPEIFMTVKSIGHFIKGGKEWMSFPSKKFTNEAGEAKYTPYIWMEKDRKEALEKKVFGLIASGQIERAANPNVEDEF